MSDEAVRLNRRLLRQSLDLTLDSALEVAAGYQALVISVPTNSGCTPCGYTTISRRGSTGISVTTSLVACFMVTCFNWNLSRAYGRSDRPAWAMLCLDCNPAQMLKGP